MNCFPGQIFLYIFQCHDVYQQFTAIFVFIKGIEGDGRFHHFGLPIQYSFLSFLLETFMF